MLNISQVSFMSVMPRVQLSQKFNKVAFGNNANSTEVVDTFERKVDAKGWLDEAWKLEQEGKPSEAERLLRIVFNRDVSEFKGKEGLETLNRAGISLLRVLLQQGLDPKTDKIVNEDKLIDGIVTLAIVHKKLLELCQLNIDSDEIYRTAREYMDYASTREKQLSDILIIPAKLTGKYLRKLDQEGVL